MDCFVVTLLRFSIIWEIASLFLSRLALRYYTASLLIVCFICFNVSKSSAVYYIDSVQYINDKSGRFSAILAPDPSGGYFPVEPQSLVFVAVDNKVAEFNLPEEQDKHVIVSGSLPNLSEGGGTATIDTYHPDKTLNDRKQQFYKENITPLQLDLTLPAGSDLSLSSTPSVTRDTDTGSGVPPSIKNSEFEVTGKQWFHGEGTTLDGTQAMAEQSLAGEKIKGMFSDKLGSFEDPMQFFSDFKTERKKTGLRAEQKTGMFKTIGLIYDSEGEVDSREQGLAGRFTYGNDRKWLVGGSYTMRRAVDAATGEDENRNNGHATAVDFRLPLLDTLEILLEAASSKDPWNNEDQGYLLRGKYDLGQIGLSGGYIDLGEYFEASYANPLHHVNRDAGGIEASVDYLMAQPLWKVNKLETNLRFFDLTRHSNDEQVKEMDGSLRFGIGENNNLFCSFFNRDEGQVSNQSLLGSLTHKWNEDWSSRFQSKYSETDSSNTLKVTVDASLKQDDDFTKLSIDWIKKEIDYSSLSLHEESRIRFDIDQELWLLQLQGKLSENGEDFGTSFYGRVEYKPTSLQRYQMVGYAAVGDKAAFEFVERFEVGMKFSF